MDNPTSRVPKDAILSPEAVKELTDRIKQMNKDFKASLVTKRYNTVYSVLVHPDDLPMFLHRSGQTPPGESTPLEITRDKVRMESDGLYTFEAFDIKNVIRNRIDDKSDKEP